MSALAFASGCLTVREDHRSSVLTVMAEPPGAMVWVERGGERRGVGPAPAVVEVPYTVRRRELSPATWVVPGVGLAVGALGGVMVAIDDRSSAPLLLMLSGLSTAVASIPFIALALYRDGEYVGAGPDTPTRIGASAPHHEEDSLAIEGVALAGGETIFLRPSPKSPGGPKLAELPPVPTATVPQARRTVALPDALRPELYRPSGD